MWLAVDLDNTLISKKTHQAEPGAAEAMLHLLSNGHRVSIWTARFSIVPDEQKNEVCKQVEQELEQNGIPYSDIWFGDKPNVDLFIGDNCVPYTGSWPQALAAAEMMLQHGHDPQPHEHEVREEKF